MNRPTCALSFKFAKSELISSVNHILASPVEYLKGVGPQRAELLKKELNIFTFRDLLEHFPDPKPAYNTVSTIVRILETKGYVGHKAFGKTHEYYPLIRQEEYTKVYFENFLQNHFNNSFQKMVSFFTKSDNLSIKELEETLRMMQAEIDKHKNSTP